VSTIQNRLTCSSSLKRQNTSPNLSTSKTANTHELFVTISCFKQTKCIQSAW